MVRNYKLFLFAQLIALSVVAPALAGEEKEAPAAKQNGGSAQAALSKKGPRARLFAQGFADAIAREDAQGDGCPSLDIEDMIKAPRKACGSCNACPSHRAQ